MKVLLIEDSPGDIRLIKITFARMKANAFEVTCADRLSQGIEILDHESMDVVLLDCNLPDSTGLESVSKLQARCPQIPIVLLTGMDDDEMAFAAVQKGVQDYLVKGEISKNLLERSLNYAIERQRLQRELQVTRQREQDAREFSSLELLAKPSGTDVTARSFGLLPLRESAPELVADFTERYGRIMDMALEQRAFRVAHNISGELRQMAQQLGSLRAGPRDVVEIHTSAIKIKSQGVLLPKSLAYMEEARLLLIELLGGLVSFYRNYYTG